MKIKTFLQKLALPIIAIATIIIPTANADHLYDPRQDCEEVSQFFDPTLPELKEGEDVPNTQQNCEQINHHSSFPGSHKQPINLNQHPKSDKTKHQPWSEHMHRYFNDSKEEIGKTVNGQKFNIYYLAVVDTFEIHLESDFMENIDLDTIECAGLPDNNNCSGTGDFGLNDDGAKLGYEVSFDKTNGTIKWYFPGKAKNMAKLNRYGENPTLDKLMNYADSTDEKNRMLELGIVFKTNESQKEAWSATTTSRILIKDFAAQMAPDAKPATTDWKAVSHPGNQPGETNDYYWFPIGTTTTIWDKPAPSICVDLNASLGQAIKINGKTAYPITVDKVTFAPKNEIPKEALYKWTSTDKKGEFWILSPLAGIEEVSYVPIGTEQATNYKQQVYYIGEKTATINVELTGIPPEQIGTECKDKVTITIEELECKEIIVEHPDKIYEGDTAFFKAKAIATNGQDWPGDIKYSVDAGHGKFYLIPPVAKQQQYSKAINLDPVLLIIGNEKSQITKTAIDLIGDIATDNFNGNIFEYMNAGKANENIDKFGLPVSAAFKKEVEKRAKDPKYNPSRSSKNNNLDLNKTLQANTLLAATDGGFGSSLDPFSNLLIDGTNLPDVYVKQAIPEKAPNLSPKFDPEKDSLLNGFKFGEKSALAGTQSLKVKANTGVYLSAEKKGEKVIHVAAEGTDNPACRADFDILEKPTDLCLDLAANIRFYGTNSVTKNNEGKPILEANKIYSLDANSTYKIPSEHTVNYSIDQAYGTFLKIYNSTDLVKAVEEIKKLQASNTLTKENLAAKVGAQNLSENITVTDNFSVVLVTYGNIPGAKTAVLKIKSNQSDEPACIKTFDIIAPPPPPVVCENLTYNLTKIQGLIIEPVAQLEPGQTYNISANAEPGVHSITYTIATGYGLFTDGSNTITVADGTGVSLLTNANAATNLATALTIQTVGATNPNCQKPVPFVVKEVPPPPEEICESLTIEEPDEPWIIDEEDDSQPFEIDIDPEDLENDLFYNWEVVEGDGRWDNGDDEFLAGNQGDITQTLEDFEDGTEVEVWASLTKNGPKLKNANGTVICLDSIEAEVKKEKKDEEEPELNKYVFSTNKIKDVDKLININKNTDYVTYMLVIDTGEKVETLEVQDPALKNGKIESSSPLDGYLDFKSMKIDIIDKKDEKYTILKTSDFEEDRDKTNKYSDTKFENIKNHSEEYSCENNKNKFCLSDDKDYDNKYKFSRVVSNFKDGDKIYFNNVDKLGDNAKIIIKYQMWNKSVIKSDPDICEKLSVSGGCGEIFENEAEFEAESTTGKNYDGKDSAKVVVLCPYILTRSGGDAFFHDLIKFSVDVGQCAEVKPCVGICEQLKPPEKEKVLKVGGGDSPETLPILDLASHDVCRLSNSNSNIEGYNNILKNFSSTICELQADVAEVWTKKYINDSISANVTRVSRWGENLTGDVTNLNSLIVPNRESGIFVKTNGDLHIGVKGGTYEIKADKDNNIPAAQTYIVKGHNLYIDSDIKYPAITDYKDTRNISSAAFIVIDGNIIIDPKVTHIDGILIAVDLNNPDTGKIMQTEESKTELLTINGNLIGNVYDLFKLRTAIGDPRKDQGSVTIRYDQRILLNTPPGISDLLDLEQAIVPN